jgi:hypothetical protein
MKDAAATTIVEVHPITAGDVVEVKNRFFTFGRNIAKITGIPEIKSGLLARAAKERLLVGLLLFKPIPEGVEVTHFITTPLNDEVADLLLTRFRTATQVLSPRPCWVMVRDEVVPSDCLERASYKLLG